MSLRVVDPGPLTTVQDAGRTGWAHLGVPRAGFLDAPSARLANRLVGNVEDEALLETTLGGVTLRAETSTVLAVTGARCEVHVDGRAVGTDRAFRVGGGQEVRVGPAYAHVRSYVAVAGGVRVAPVLGSRSTDTLSWTGPPVLVAGASVPVGEPYGRPRTADVVPPPTSSGVLRLHPGPRQDWLADPGELDGRVWQVTGSSDRVGLRLVGTRVQRREGEVRSEGIVLGAVQAPPSGELVVFLHDHPVPGGCPVVAVLDAEDLAECARIRPGQTLTSRLVGTWH